MIRVLYRGLISLFCRHEWHTVKCIKRIDWEGKPLPLEYVACRKCGMRRNEDGWDD